MKNKKEKRKGSVYVGRWLMVNEVSLVQAAVSPLVTLATTYNLTIFSTSSNIHDLQNMHNTLS